MRKNYPISLRIVIIVLLCLLLTACHRQPVETQPSTEPPTVCYTARFVMGGNVLSEQTLEEGQLPEAVEAQVQGLKFLYWTDENGEQVLPETVRLTADVTYTAAYYPVLDKHECFLFADTNGMIRPDEALTADELILALKRLAAEGADKYFPGMPIGSEPLTVQKTKNVLNHFFGSEAVENAFGILEGKMTRGEFAGAMCTLLGRDPAAAVKIAEFANIPADITMGRADCAALLESCVPHTEDLAGVTWTSLELKAGYEPGFVNVDGWLYYVKEDGYFLRSGNVGDLQFGANGRYTSGDVELDAIVAGILKNIMEANPSADRLTLLRRGHEYCRDAFTYLRKNAYAMGKKGWEINDAKVMFTTLRGNCYNYAASFWAVARGLGYEAYAISGTVTQTDQPHGWVEIDFDGKTYIFDCEWEMAYRVKQNRYDMDMFMIDRQSAKYWNYKWK